MLVPTTSDATYGAVVLTETALHDLADILKWLAAIGLIVLAFSFKREVKHLVERIQSVRRRTSKSEVVMKLRGRRARGVRQTQRTRRSARPTGRLREVHWSGTRLLRRHTGGGQDIWSDTEHGDLAELRTQVTPCCWRARCDVAPNFSA